jgi:hypothetical protein
VCCTGGRAYLHRGTGRAHSENRSSTKNPMFPEVSASATALQTSPRQVEHASAARCGGRHVTARIFVPKIPLHGATVAAAYDGVESSGEKTKSFLGWAPRNPASRINGLFPAEIFVGNRRISLFPGFQAAAVFHGLQQVSSGGSFCSYHGVKAALSFLPPAAGLQSTVRVAECVGRTSCVSPAAGLRCPADGSGCRGPSCVRRANSVSR